MIQKLDILPAWTQIQWTPDYRIANRDDPFKWGGKSPPPAIGSEVSVGVNAIGRGVVLSYFLEEGFLGVLVQPHSPPEWYIKQNGIDKPCHVFGAELEDI
jgi:hypothetical protein